jgi:hypothetical protein
MCGKYLRVFGEYAECIKAFKKNMANWGHLRYTKLSPNTRKVFKHIRRICRKNLFVHGEDEKRFLAYSLQRGTDDICVSFTICFDFF